MAHRLMGGVVHGGSSSARFACRLMPGGAVWLVAWGEAAEALAASGIPCRRMVFRFPRERGGVRTVRVRHLTPTVLKPRGGRRVWWFDFPAYAEALAGVFRLAGLDVRAEDVLSRASVERVSVSAGTWPVRKGAERGFVGEVVLRVPAEWAWPLRLASLTGLGCKRAWGMGNVAVSVPSSKSGANGTAVR
jgi:hypothetical protein